MLCTPAIAAIDTNIRARPGKRRIRWGATVTVRVSGGGRHRDCDNANDNTAPNLISPQGPYRINHIASKHPRLPLGVSAQGEAALLPCLCAPMTGIRSKSADHDCAPATVEQIPLTPALADLSIPNTLSAPKERASLSSELDHRWMTPSLWRNAPTFI